LAIVAECKNYKKPLDENELIISVKYVGKKKLSTLILIISRTGLSRSGHSTQQKIWNQEEKMLLCLNDSDLAKMIELKDTGDESWKVIDYHIRKLRSSLS